MEATGYDIVVTVLYWDPEYGYSWATGYAYSFVEPGTPPPPTISGPAGVWWFQGETPALYSTSITLTSDSGVPLNWTLISGGSYASLSTSYGTQTVLTPTNFSVSYGDLQVQGSSPFGDSNVLHITAYTPYSLLHLGDTTTCDYQSTLPRWFTTITYQIKDQFGNYLPDDVPSSEEFPTSWTADYGGTNWPSDPTFTGGGTQFGGVLRDYVRPPGHADTFPAPACNGDDTPVEHRDQRYRIGSTVEGYGRIVQYQTLFLLLGLAYHGNIF